MSSKNSKSGSLIEYHYYLIWLRSLCESNMCDRGQRPLYHSSQLHSVGEEEKCVAKMQMQEEGSRLVGPSLSSRSTRHLRIKHKILNTWKWTHPLGHPFGPHTSRTWSMALANVTRFLHYSIWQNTWMQESHRTVLFFFVFAYGSPVYINQMLQAQLFD